MCIYLNNKIRFSLLVYGLDCYSVHPLCFFAGNKYKWPPHTNQVNNLVLTMMDLFIHSSYI
jgi:hypothetical protein